MNRLLSAPFAEFFDFDFAFHFFAIFARPVVNALANGTMQFYEVVLRHSIYYSMIFIKYKPAK